MTFFGYPNSVSQSFVTASSNAVFQLNAGTVAPATNYATETLWKWNQRDLSQFDFFVVSGTLPATSYSLSVVTASFNNLFPTAIRLTLTGSLPACLLLFKPKGLRVPSRHQVSIFFQSASNAMGNNVRLAIVSFANDTTSSSNFTGFGIAKSLASTTNIFQTHYVNGTKAYDITRAFNITFLSTDQGRMLYSFAYSSASLNFNVERPFFETDVALFNNTSGNALAFPIPFISRSYDSTLSTHQGECVYFGFEITSPVVAGNGHFDIGNIEILQHPVDQRYIYTYVNSLTNV